MTSCEINRSGIDMRALWKASEWRSFLLYYSLSVLRGILSKKYFKHWFLLVFTFQTLLKDKVITCDISIAKVVLNKFVEKAESLYGIENLSFNMHLLLHMPRYVKDWGAPWASSAFTYEHGNGLLVGRFNGTQNVADQIFRYYELSCYIEQIAPSVFNERSFESASQLFGKLVYNDETLKNAHTKMKINCAWYRQILHTKSRNCRKYRKLSGSKFICC